MAVTISGLIASTEAGDASAADRLFSALYAELHTLARRQLDRIGSGVTLGPTTLLHEAYLSMADREGSVFPDRPRFMGYAAKVMRGLIVDHARERAAQKRGGGFRVVTLNEEAAGLSQADDAEILRVGTALEELASVDPPLAGLVDLKFFCGFSFSEIAQVRGVSERTVQRQWEKARIYLRRRIREASG